MTHHPENSVSTVGEGVAPARATLPPLTVVVVLYRCRPDDSPALRSIVECLVPTFDIQLLIWDNSPAWPDEQARRGQWQAWRSQYGDRFGELSIVTDESNSGLTRAYNAAVKLAADRGDRWMLTFDQDTALSEDFANQLGRVLKQTSEELEPVVALAPRVMEGRTQCSPLRIVGGLPWMPLPIGPAGTLEDRCFVINSGLCIRVDFLQSIGGYDESYQLDFVDHWLAEQIYRTGHRVLLFDAVIPHEQSVNDVRNRISLARHRSILESQTRFAKQSTCRWTRWILLSTLPAHAIKRWYQTRDRRFATTAMRQWWELLRR